jgi:Tfp pilus assembly protein PilP
MEINHLKEIDKINEQIFKLKKKREKINEEYQESIKDASLSIRFNAWLNSDPGESDWIPNSPKISKWIDKYDFQRHETIDITEYAEDEFLFLTQPENYKKTVVGTQWELNEEDIKYYSELAEEMIETDVCSFTLDW